MHQKTLRASCHIRGVGLHSGKDARLTLLPAPVNHGIVFRVRQAGREVEIPAKVPFITRTLLSTSIGRDGIEVCTIEHLMAALSGLEVDNAIVVVEGAEVPVLDGSALGFVQHVEAVGLKLQPASRWYLRILAPIEVQDGDRSAGLYPAAHPSYSMRIDYPHKAVGTQELSVPLTRQHFIRELAACRTFGFVSELETLQANGFALGAGLDNAVGLAADGTILNPEGLRCADEFVRHKLLDAVGDMYLAGHHVLGEFRGVKSGHSIHVLLLEQLFAMPECWELVPAAELSQARAV